MGHITSFFSRVDAAIQRRFDSVCFFLMRRFGVRKSMIRYTLNALGIVGLLSFTGQAAATSGRYAAFGLVGIVGAMIMLIQQHGDMAADQAAERDPHACSTADSARYGWTKLVWSSVLLFAIGRIVGVIPSAASPTLADIPSRATQLIMSGLALMAGAGLALEYLKKTPMNPPAEKAREHAEVPRTAPART